MKIVILVLGFFENAEYQENLLLRYYEKFGHEVHVIACTNTSILHWNKRSDKAAPEATYKVGNATIHRLRYTLDLFNRIERFTELNPLLETIKPDLITVHNIILNLDDCTRYVRRHPECKMIVDFHGDFSNSGNSWLSLKFWHGFILKRVLDRARPYTARIYPITPGSQAFMAQIYKIPQSEMEVLPLGADIDLIDDVRAEGARAAKRREYGIADDAILVFTGGKLVPSKKIEVLIDAVSAYPDRQVNLVIVGKAPVEHSTYEEALVRRAGNSPNIHFAGWLKSRDIYRHFLASDLAMFPAGQSILWQQAIAAGLPLVVGEWEGGTQDVSYLNLANNIIVIPSDKLEEEFPTQLRRLIDDKVLRDVMSAGAKKVTAELLDWNVLALRTLQYN